MKARILDISTSHAGSENAIELMFSVCIPLRVTGPTEISRFFARGLCASNSSRSVRSGLGGWRLPQVINVGPIIPAELSSDELELMLVEVAEELRRRAMENDNGCHSCVEVCTRGAGMEAIS